MEYWGLRTATVSTTAYRQSNGLTKSAIKGLKALFKKMKNKPEFEAFRGLLELRNTGARGRSIAEVVGTHYTPEPTIGHLTKWLVLLDEHDCMTAEIATKATATCDQKHCHLYSQEQSSCALRLNWSYHVIGTISGLPDPIPIGPVE